MNPELIKLLEQRIESLEATIAADLCPDSANVELAKTIGVLLYLVAMYKDLQK